MGKSFCREVLHGAASLRFQKLVPKECFLLIISNTYDRKGIKFATWGKFGSILA